MRPRNRRTGLAGSPAEHKKEAHRIYELAKHRIQFAKSELGQRGCYHGLQALLGARATIASADVHAQEYLDHVRQGITEKGHSLEYFVDRELEPVKSTVTDRWERAKATFVDRCIRDRKR
jgi:hypothetical protein